MLRTLARQREMAGDRTGAEAVAREAADRGEITALASLGLLRERAGDLTGAENLYRQAADRGDIMALGHMAMLREKAGDPIGANLQRRFGLTDDGAPANSTGG